jgi:hypothetical protein
MGSIELPAVAGVDGMNTPVVDSVDGTVVDVGDVVTPGGSGVPAPVVVVVVGALVMPGGSGVVGGACVVVVGSGYSTLTSPTPKTSLLPPDDDATTNLITSVVVAGATVNCVCMSILVAKTADELTIVLVVLSLELGTGW